MSSDLIRRIAITLGAVLAYRIGDDLALPGVEVSAWMQLLWPESSPVLFD